jgi:hypothetical protein
LSARSFAAQSTPQPQLRKLPIAFDRADIHAQHARDFRFGQAAEEEQFHDARTSAILRRELFERLIQHQQFVQRFFFCGQQRFIQRDLSLLAAAFVAVMRFGIIDQVAVNYAVADNCSASSAITCSLTVSSNEPVSGTGDGDTAPDWEIVDAHHVRLRAEHGWCWQFLQPDSTGDCAEE